MLYIWSAGLGVFSESPLLKQAVPAGHFVGIVVDAPPWQLPCFMSLPNREEAYVDRRKLTDYLLNTNHPDAKGKSAFFYERYGTDWKQLREDLLEHAKGPVTDVEETRHGTRYVIEGTLSGALVRSVWMIRTGESIPRLVTAYPIY